jgi:hypothetical protein
MVEVIYFPKKCKCGTVMTVVNKMHNLWLECRNPKCPESPDFEGREEWYPPCPKLE